MKLWGEIKTRLIEQHLRIVLAASFMIPLVLCFVALYQGGNVEEAYAEESIVNACDLPLKAIVHIGYFTASNSNGSGSNDIIWNVVSNEDIDGDGINDPCLVTHDNDKRVSPSWDYYYNYYTQTDYLQPFSNYNLTETKGQYEGLSNRYATSMLRYIYNNRWTEKPFFEGNSYCYELKNIPSLTWLFTDSEWNSFKLAKIKTLVSSKQATYKAYDGGNALFIENNTSNTIDWSNFETAYYENTYDRLFQVGIFDMNKLYKVYDEDAKQLLNEKYVRNSTNYIYRAYAWRDPKINSDKYFMGLSASDSTTYNWTSGVPLNKIGGAAAWGCYLDGNERLIYNGTYYRLAPDNYTSELSYARATSCFPNDVKAPSDLNGAVLAGRVENFGNAIVTEMGWYIGLNVNNYNDDSVVKITQNGDNETISNKAVKIKYEGSLKTPDYYQMKVNFPDYLQYETGDYVWVRAYVKSKLSPWDTEKTRFGTAIRIIPKTYTASTSVNDNVITGIKHPSELIGHPMSENVTDESRDWTSSIRWGHFDNDQIFVEETGNFEANKDYWAEITLTAKGNYRFGSVSTQNSINDDSLKYYVLNADDIKLTYNPNNTTTPTAPEVYKIYAFYKQKNISSLSVGNTVKMGNFNGHELTWKVSSMHDLDNDGVKETPLLVLDTYLKESGSDNPYLKNFSNVGDRGRYPDEDRVANGSNRYAESVIRRWLNTRDANITYSSSLHFDDTRITDGFLSDSNFTDDEFNAIRQTKIKTITSWYDGEVLSNKGTGTQRHIYETNLTDIYQNYNGSYYEETEDLVFLMGIEDLAYADATNGNGVNIDLGTSYWLRDSRSDKSDEVRTVDSGLSVTSSKANLNKAIRPALYLRGDATLVSLGGGTFKIGSTERKARPATVVNKEIDYSKTYYASSSNHGSAAGFYLDNFDNVQVLEVGYVSDTGSAHNISVKSDGYGNEKFILNKNNTKLENTRYAKKNHEINYKINWSDSKQTIYYRPYVKSFVDGKVITKYGNIMSYTTGPTTSYKGEINDFVVDGVYVAFSGSRVTKPNIVTGQWTVGIDWYEEDGNGGFKTTTFTGYHDQTKTYKAEIYLTPANNYYWGDLPANTIKVRNATTVTHDAVTNKQAKVVVTAIFEPEFFRVGDINNIASNPIYLGTWNTGYYKAIDYKDIDDDGVAEYLFALDNRYYLTAPTSSSTNMSMNLMAQDVKTTTGYKKYEIGVRWDLSYSRKWLNFRPTWSDGSLRMEADRYQNWYYANNATTYTSSGVNIFNTAYGIKDYEYDAIKIAKWKFRLGSHEINDLKMAERWDGFEPFVAPSSSQKQPNVEYYYYPNLDAYYAYSYEKISTMGIEEMYIKNPGQSASNYGSGTTYVAFRDGIGNQNKIFAQALTSSSSNLTNQPRGATDSNGVIPCFYLEPDVILDTNSDRNNNYGISKYNEPTKDYAISITGEPIYSKTPSTLDKVLMTGDCDNFAYADIKEKGWYFGYNHDDQMDYSMLDPEVIQTSGVKVVYKRDLNRKDGYYEQMVDLKELFPDYQVGDYVWVRSYVKSKYDGAPLKETYGNRIRLRPEYTNKTATTAVDDYYITGLLNPAHYYGMPISSYENTVDPSCAWTVDSIVWGTYDGTTFTEKTSGNFRMDTEYTVKVTLKPKSPYAFSSSISANYFRISGASKTWNATISSGSTEAVVYGTFPNIILMSAPEAPEPTLTKEGSTLTASWEEPDDNGAEITEYVIQLDDNEPETVSSETLTKTYTNVSNSSHIFRIKAVNEMGESDEGIATIVPLYEVPNNEGVAYWEEDLAEYEDGGESKKAIWDISLNNDGSVFAYLFKTKNNSNEYVDGEETLVFAGNGSNIIDFNYAYTGSSNDFYKTGSDDVSSLSISGYNYRSSSIIPWSWINRSNTNIKHVVFSSGTNFTDWDLFFAGMDNLTDITFNGEGSKAPVSMERTFADTSNVAINFAKINTANTTNMKGTFENSDIASLDLSTWSSNSLVNMESMLSGIKNAASVSFGDEFTMESVINADYLFASSNFTSLDLSKVKLGSLTSMRSWFQNCDDLKSVKFGSSLDTSTVAYFNSLFDGCTSLGLEITNGLTDGVLDLSMFDSGTNTSQVTNMFSGCSSLKGITFGTSFKLGNVTSVKNMFKGCENLTEVNLSNFELDSLTEYEDMFTDCDNITKIYIPQSLKAGCSIDLPAEGFLPYTSAGLIVSDISDTTHLISKTLEGPSGINADYVKVASETDLKINGINNAANDEAIYNIIRLEDFKNLLPDGDLKTEYSGSSLDTKKLCANYLYNKIHSGGTINPYSNFANILEDLGRVVNGGEKVEYETLEILPGEKGKYKVTGLLSNTNEIKVTYNDGTNNITNSVTAGTEYDTIVVNGAVTYTFTKTVKNSTLFTDPITISTVTFANHLTLVSGDITFTGGPFTFNGLNQYVTPTLAKYPSASFQTTYKLKGTSTLIAKSDIVNAGTYVCHTKILGPDFIDGVLEDECEFTIERLSFTDNSTLNLVGYDSSVPFTNKAHKPQSLGVALGTTELNSGSDYSITYGDNVNAPTGSITVVGEGNYTGSKTFTFTIVQRDISLYKDDFTITGLEDEEVTGAPIEPNSFKVFDEELDREMIKNTDYTITFSNNVNLGEAKLTITGCGNYKGTKDFTFNIVGVKVNTSSISIDLDDSNIIYDGSAKTPSFTVKVNGNPITNSDYEIVEWKDNINATTSSLKAKLVIKLKNNFSSDKVTKEFTIKPLDITGNSDVTLENIPNSFVYDGMPKTVTGTTLKWKTNELTLNTDYTMQVSNNTNAGTDTGVIKITGKGNFTGTKNFNFSIMPRNFTSNADIKATIEDAEWTGSQIKPETFKVWDEGILVGSKAKELVKGTDYKITGYGTNTAIGENGGSITIEGLGNYSGSKTVNFDIVGQIVRDLSRIKVEIDDADVTYDGTPKTPTGKIKVKLDNDYLSNTEWEVVDSSWKNNVNANEHSGAQKATVDIKLKGNLSSSPVTKEFTIHPKEIDYLNFEYKGSVITKAVSKKSDYNNTVPSSEKSKIIISLIGDENTKLKFTNAEFVGIDPNDNPKKFGQTDVKVSGLSLDNKNYKLKDTFTSFNIGLANGLLTDKIKPELDTDWVSIPSGLYHSGDKLFVTLKFDKKIVHSGENPILEFWSMKTSDGSIGTYQSGKYIAKANFKEVSNNEVTFEYEVKDGDYLPHGFTLKLASVNKFNTLKDELGNEISFETREKLFTDVKIVTADAVINNLINEIQGNKSKEQKEQIIKDILNDPDMFDVIFELPRDNDIVSKLQNDEDLREYVAKYLSNITLTSDNKKEELIDEIRKAIKLKETEDAIKTIIQNPSLTKEELDDAMIIYQKLTENQKKNFDKTLKEELDSKYYGMFTDDYIYEDKSEKDSDRIEVYGIVTRTSAGSSPVKLKVERITDIERINDLQSLVTSNKGGEVEDPMKEKIVAPYDITLVDESDSPVSIPSDKVLCRIDIPSSYFGNMLNIYHKKMDDTLEKINSSFVEKLDDKTAVYFECDSFSPYFMTSDVNSIKAQIDPESTPGTVSPLGLSAREDNENQVFHFTKSGDTNRVDIILYKYDKALGEYVEVTGINPINLNTQTSYTLPRVDTNYQISFKFSHDDEFNVKENPKPEVVNAYTITVGKGENKAYMEGYKDGTFRPNNYMTRAEAATVIARISPAFNPNGNYKAYTNGFKDLDKASWSANYIGYVISKGYMCGDKKGFRPNDFITRGEFTKIVYKLKENELKQVAINLKFTDVTGKFYQDYSNTLYSAKLIEGYGDGTFKGQNPITRSEVCSIINDVLGRGKDKKATLDAVKASGNMKTFKDLPEDRWFYFDDIIATVTYIQ